MLVNHQMNFLLQAEQVALAALAVLAAQVEGAALVQVAQEERYESLARSSSQQSPPSSTFAEAKPRLVQLLNA